MTFDELQQLVAKGESETIEFLESPHSPKLYEVISALANTNGGRIILGVKKQAGESPEVTLANINARNSWFIGFDPAETSLRIASPTVMRMYSTEAPKVTMESVHWDHGDGHYFPIVTVKKSKLPVRMADGRHLIRRGNRTIPEDGAGTTNPQSTRESQESVEHELSVEQTVGVEVVRPTTAPIFGVGTMFIKGALPTLSLSPTSSLENGASERSAGQGAEPLSDTTVEIPLSTLKAESPSVGIQQPSPELPPLAVPNEVLAGTASVAFGASATLEGAVALEGTSPDGLVGGIPSDDADSHGTRPAQGSRVRIARESTAPCLNVEEYASVLAELFQSSLDNERLTFALFGPWGRGKTYLMTTVAKQLAKGSYHAVHFSAWKYRSTPELWAHLYETVFQKAWASNWLLPVRSNLVRVGIWPAVLALFGLYVTLLTVVQRVDILMYLIGALGLGGVLYGVGIYRSFSGAAERMRSQYLSVTRHDDKLGLQAAIGRDLESLLVAWIPRMYWSLRWPRQPSKDANQDLSEVTIGAWIGQLIGGLLYYVLAGLIGMHICATFTSTHETEFAVNYGTFAIGSVYLYCGLGCSLTLFLWGLLALAVLWGDRKKRLLLIVDDLDRCDSAQMLTVAESLMLMLENERVGSRVQVAMLLEEDAFRLALWKKYVAERPSSKATGKRNDADLTLPEVFELTRDNLEKLFLVHLRLPPLSHDELVETMRGFTGEICQPEALVPSSSSVLDQQVHGGREVHDDTTGAAVIADNVDANDSRQESPFPLTPFERKELVDALDAMCKDRGLTRHLGPRGIRCLIFRFQLARMLLQKLGKTPDTAKLIRSLFREEVDPTTFAKGGVDQDPVQWVVHQVC